MKQVQFTAFGQPSQVARLVDVVDLAPPSAWEVVVDIEAFPINVSDLATLSGHYGTLPKLPSTIGMEAVGTISQCGSSVRTVSPGDRVILLANNNWAERRKVPLATVHPVTRDADLLQMSLLKVNPATALMLLKEHQQLMEGDWIIQSAPLSSVGQCVIQIASSMGVRTVNVVRRAETTAKILSLGGSIVVEDGPDLNKRVTDIIGSEPIRLGLDAVAGPASIDWRNVSWKAQRSSTMACCRPSLACCRPSKRSFVTSTCEVFGFRKFFHECHNPSVLNCWTRLPLWSLRQATYGN